MIPQASAKVINAYLEAKAKYDIATRALNDDILERMPFKRGDIVRNKHTGNKYRILGGYGHFTMGRVCCSLHCERVYMTGRKSAASNSYLQPEDLEIPTNLCTICYADFPTELGLVSHMREKHGDS